MWPTVPQRARPTPRALKRDWYPPKLGPERVAMLKAVGVDPLEDPRRLGFA